MPVMEGKAMLFKEFGGVDAWPICLATKDVDEIVAVVRAIAPGFGGVNLEDISAPRCFEIERRLREELDIPVFHDDQHGTAIVVLAALENALKVVGKAAEDVRVVVVGAGAAGVACTDIMLAARRPRHRRLRPPRRRARRPRRPDAGQARVRRAHQPARADGHRRRGAGRTPTSSSAWPGPAPSAGRPCGRWRDDAIVFAMANPTPEVLPEEIPENVAVIATGRSDYPNQINNVLAFPGVFRGALDVRATTIDEEMKLAAAQAIAEVIAPEELIPEYIVPSVFNRRVGEAVAEAVARAAVESGVARRQGTEAEVV